ncbi:hypothetical protein [Bosea sp. (in: a-proteobacteria)]|uniref:hypothetical protein n=1 Tax=Bosea sp. (in: a-proteobacteria) TaxID=1871050 RepID=UPI003B3AE015
MDDRDAYRLPAVVTHNFDPERGAFRNLCSLSDDAAQSVLASIANAGHRSIRPNYLARRRATEAWLLSERTRKLGVPKRQHPIYFFLGDMSDGADPSRLRSCVLPLASLPPDSITFTYPDSMTSYLIGFRDDLAAERLPHHGKLFTLAEIVELIAQEGLPVTRWKSEPQRRHDRFIEMQLWDDAPLVGLEGAG